jgi:demethylmenaquinone methyltransferase/2-methoxy-6-polyprenyl-1,4-benzoquinol methylase
VKTERNRFATELFDSVAPQYERMAAILSLGQDGRWRDFLVSTVTAPAGTWVLDGAAGTQLVSRAIARRRGVRVVALDQSESMLRTGAAATSGAEGAIRRIASRAERLPFADDAFGSVAFTYLLRYVDDPGATVAELARVLRPGGSISMLEFSLPAGPVARAGWRAYTRAALPLLGGLSSPAWGRTARFLGPNIARFLEDHPVDQWVRWFEAAGVVEVRVRRFLFGTSVVLWGVKGGRT